MEIGQTAYIAVTAAMLWDTPQKARRQDTPALKNPVDLRSWTDRLDVESLTDLANRDCTVSQALMGNRVLIRDLQRQDGEEWARIAVAEQSTPRDAMGYPGWIPVRQLADSPAFALREKWPFLQVHATKTPLFHDSALSQPVNEAVYGVRLPYLEAKGGARRVMLPDGSTAYLRSDVATYNRTASDLPPPTASNLLNAGKRFLGTPYIWGGLTPYGFDCSGLMYALFRAHGVTLPRDTPQQFQQGVTVAATEMRPGDLLFFGKGGRRGRIHHVGLYAGKAMMLHAPNPRRRVVLATLRSSGFYQEFIACRRIGAR